MKFFDTEFAAGSPISTKGFAKALNGIAKAWETLSVYGGRVDWSPDGRPKIIMDSVAAARQPQLFEVVHEYADYLQCAFVSAVDETTDDPIPNEIPETDPPTEEVLMTVFKPWGLRSTPFDGRTRGGYTYTTQDQSTRKAVKDGEEEFQTITPSYLKRESGSTGEMIYGVWFEGDGWVDINALGRCWAVNDDYTESLGSIPGASAIPDPATIPV